MCGVAILEPEASSATGDENTRRPIVANVTSVVVIVVVVIAVVVAAVAGSRKEQSLKFLFFRELQQSEKQLND